MRKPLLLTAIEDYAKSNPARFHMPGHKGGGDMQKRFPFAECDITELSFSGCLTSCEGIVKTAQENVAEILGVGRSHFVTDGSSASILAMLYALSKYGKKVIIPRNSHKSVYNALKLFNLSPLFLECKFVDGIPVQNVDSAKELLKEDGVAGMLLTSPDYYGQIPDLALARGLTLGAGKFLAIDGAHGGHMKFTCPEKYAGAFADVWVDGVHKTLPCLTQASVLNVNSPALYEGVEEGLSLIRTTSPSYPIMASIEYGIYYAEAEGNEAFSRVFSAVNALKERLSRKEIFFYPAEDRAKLLLDCFKSGIDVSKVCEYLESQGIYPEFSDKRYVVFMVSLNTEESHLLRLEKALEEYVQKNKKVAQNAQNSGIFTYTAKRCAEYIKAISAPYELVEGKSAIGRISADNVGTFPPCYPVITAGEVFTQDIVDALTGNENVYGKKDGKFKVLI